MFTATAVADTVNDPPFLVRPLTNPSTTTGTPVTFTLPAIDLEGDPMTFEAILQGSSANNATVSVNGNQVTVTPTGSFSGTLSLLVGVMQTGATTRGNDNVLFDTALMSVTVNAVATTTTVTSSVNPSFFGQSVTFTATVSAPGSTSIPQGTVQFTVDGKAVGGPVTLNAAGQATFSISTLSSGAHSVVASFTSSSAAFLNSDNTASPFTQNVGALSGHYVATGADVGGAPQVNVYDARSGVFIASFLAFPASFTGGVRVAVGDVNGDGVDDIIVGAGPGGLSQVNVYDGTNFQLMRSFLVWPSTFTGGVFVAAGDVNGDGLADIVVGADRGFSSAIASQNTGSIPEVKVFSGATSNALLLDFFAFPLTFGGGVRVAAGDVNGDGKADVIVGAGPGGLPQVSIFDGTSAQLLGTFFAFGTKFSGGVYVSARDLNGDGKADVITGEGAGGSPLVNTFDGSTLAMLDSFLAYLGSFSGGVRVGADRTSARTAILTAAGPGAGPQVSGFDVNHTLLTSFFAYPPAFTGGVFIAGD
jgi:hypothetical protein